MTQEQQDRETLTRSEALLADATARTRATAALASRADAALAAARALRRRAGQPLGHPPPIAQPHAPASRPPREPLAPP